MLRYFICQIEVAPSDFTAIHRLVVTFAILAIARVLLLKIPVFRENFYGLTRNIFYGLSVVLLFSSAAGFNFLTTSIAFIMITAVINFASRELEAGEQFQENTDTIATSPCLLYKGEDLEFSNDDLHFILTKYFPFYGSLNIEQKAIFLYRLRNFISQKLFYIHDKSGFREMPVLTAATAIAISLGWEKYELQSIDHIHIYPDAFVYAYPFPRALEGNVTGNNLSLSWKHFLNGFQLPDNGQNVGLHEFAHAYQNEFCSSPKAIDYGFIEQFNHFRELAIVSMPEEKISKQKLYTDYGLQNIEEFWAESIELFFEKPIILKSLHPKIYTLLCRILNREQKD